MVEPIEQRYEVCVVGRCDFATGIGSVTYAACEMFGRNFPTCIFPTEPALRGQEHITLPNGRQIPVCKDPNAIRASLYCDVIWNGAGDHNYALFPKGGLKLATLVWDSDELPSEWVSILNDHFDGVVCLSPHLVEMAQQSGVNGPFATVPLALDLEGLSSEPFAPLNKKLRVGCVAAFHPRKGIPILMEAFASLYAGRDDIELFLHSNLAFGGTVDRIKNLAATLGLTNIVVSTEALSVDAKSDLISSFDVFCNFSQGEGYSIGAREALAMGKVLALSKVGGHQDLSLIPGVFLAPATQTVPARYPEIDNRIIGTQRVVGNVDAKAALLSAVEYVSSETGHRTRFDRREAAAQFSFGRLSTSYAALIQPEVLAFRAKPLPSLVSIPDGFIKHVQKHLSAVGGLSHPRRTVVQAHDAGFFSLFNVFFSHLVWDIENERCHAVIPDWDVDRMISRYGAGYKFVSFCYGRPGDGNIWLKLFQPLYGLTEAEMDNPEDIYRYAETPEFKFNESREPLLTYIHAYELYRQKWFSDMRHQYHAVFQKHIKLRTELSDEIEDFVERNFSDKFMIAAHVRHPSHTVEQPDAVIAHADTYIARVVEEVAAAGLDAAGNRWGVFLATDQDRVVRRFEEVFGTQRVSVFRDVRRTRDEEDAEFDALSASEKNEDGHQLQHIVASNPESWSGRMAWEVVRDAYVMARCNVLFHVVSNVSTAVAYMNPELKLKFVKDA